MSSILNDVKSQFRTGDITTKIIFWNIGAFVLSLVIFYQFKFGIFDYPNWLMLSSESAVYYPWTLLTYSFLHAGFLHLLFNMLVLNFSGRLFLTFFTPKQFLGAYILSSIFAGIAFAAYYFILGSVSVLVGASAAIMAILVAATTYQPMMNVRLLLIGNVKLWHITAVILILDLMQIRLENTGGHISHLAGALFGFGYIKLLQNGTDLSRGVSFILDKLANIGTPRKATPFKKVHKNYNRRPQETPSRIVTKDKTQQQIDEILDKISKSGYDSLTAGEKDFLFRAGKQ